MQDKRVTQKNIYLKKTLFWILPPAFLVLFGVFLFWPLILILDSITYTFAVSKDTAGLATTLIRSKEVILVLVTDARKYFSYILWLIAAVFAVRSIFSAIIYSKLKKLDPTPKERLEFYIATALFYIVFGLLVYGLVNLEKIIFVQAATV